MLQFRTKVKIPTTLGQNVTNEKSDIAINLNHLSHNYRLITEKKEGTIRFQRSELTSNPR